MKSKILFIADVDIFGPSITRVLVKNETEKSVVSENTEGIINGKSHQPHFLKKNYCFFKTIPECWKYIEKRMQLKIKAAEEELNFERRGLKVVRKASKMKLSQAKKYIDGIDWF